MLVYSCSEGSQSIAINGAGQGYPVCATGGAWIDVEALDATCCTAAQMELIGITAPKIAAAFGWGFAAITLVAALGYGIRAVNKTVNQI